MTAQEAYDLALAAYQGQLDEIFEEIEEDIKNYAEQGNFIYDYKGILLPELKDRLIELGYKITDMYDKVYDDRLGYSIGQKFIRISWYKGEEVDPEPEPGSEPDPETTPDPATNPAEGGEEEDGGIAG